MNAGSGRCHDCVQGSADLSLAEAAYLAGLIDGEGTVTLSRKHAGDMRQLVVSISNTELPILEFALLSVGAGKLTRKRTERAHHTPSYAYALWNRQALALLAQIDPSLRSTSESAQGSC